MILTPAELVVRFGDPVSVNCSTPMPDVEGMGWESTVGGIPFENTTALTWTLDRLEDWTIKPECYVTLTDDQCVMAPNITLYSEYK